MNWPFVARHSIAMLDLSNLPVGFAENPFGHYEQLAKYAPVCAQGDGSFIISRHRDLSMIYRDVERFHSDKKSVFEPKFGAGSPLFEHHTSSLVFNDPPLHTRVRRIMTGALTPKALKRMQPGLENTVDTLLNTLPDKPDLIDAFAARIPIQVIGNLLNVPTQERAPLRDWSLAILGALEPNLHSTQLEQGHRAVSEFKDYLRDLIARRRKHPGDPDSDVLTMLIAGDQTGTLSEIELIQNCIFILNAGHETTTNLIGNGLALLADFPEQRRLLRRHPELGDTAIEEILRYQSPNQFGNRETSVDVSLHGVEIPRGSNLHLCIGAANRDEDVFPRAQIFDVTRSPNRHLAFAGGPHVCVGLTLARMEGRIAITRFVERFPNYEITGRVSGNRVRFRGYQALAAKL